MVAAKFSQPVFVLAAVAVVLGAIHPAEARLKANARTKSVLTSARQVVELPPVAMVEPCCPQPCITYRYRGCQDVCCGCEPPIQTVLQVIDPCTCCPVEIPVCLPGCCADAPKVCSDRGLLGRDVVWFDWCCGFSVKVTFRKRGDVLVTYVGR